MYVVYVHVYISEPFDKMCNCKIDCLTLGDCKRAYSRECGNSKVECAMGKYTVAMCSMYYRYFIRLTGGPLHKPSDTLPLVGPIDGLYIGQQGRLYFVIKCTI